MWTLEPAHQLSYQQNNTNLALRARPAPPTPSASLFNGKAFAADIDGISAQLQHIQSSGSGVIAVPLPTGELIQYKLKHSPIVSEALAGKFPEIMTFSGEEVNGNHRGRFDLTPTGFHAILEYQGEKIFVEPVDGYYGRYRSYYAKHGIEGREFIEEELSGLRKPKYANLSYKLSAKSQPLIQRPQLIQYRLVVATTGEYSQYHGGTLSSVQSAIVTAVNRVYFIFERDFGVRLQLTDTVIHLDPLSDPYSNDDILADLNLNTGVINDQVGVSNYDIGHLFGGGYSGGVGGVGRLLSVCNDSTKGDGVSGTLTPDNDFFYTNILAHELGHQFNAQHTFNANSGACSNHRRSQYATEPGSGSTIMGYGGSCSPAKLQNQNDAYFHTKTIDVVSEFIASTVSSCGTPISTDNTPPVVVAGSDHTIPARTPIKLVGSANDIDEGDVLSYGWEQTDVNGIANNDLTVDPGSGPIFRSWFPTSENYRYLPTLDGVLTGNLETGEAWPTTNRTMTFKLTVRDNTGGIGSDEKVITVDANSGPFKVTEPMADSTVWASTELVWDTAGTDVAPVNCTAVDVLLDYGDNSFSQTLLSETANDGFETIALPLTPSNSARLMVQCSDNVFFAVSDMFSIEATPDFNQDGPLFTGQLQNLRTDLCIQVENSSIASGANVEPGNCVEQCPNQLLNFKPVADRPDTFVIEFSHSNLCLDVANGSSADAASLIQQTCDDSASQQFRVIDEGNQWVIYTGTGSGNKVMDSHARRSDIIQYRDYGNDNQRWRFFTRTEVQDSDGDGIPDSQDAFPNDPLETVDSDGDGIGDNSDAFPFDANDDSDGDGISGHIDNCPADYNPDQIDTNNNGIGDACDTAQPIDSDNDGVPDSEDLFPNDPNETVDSDGDGIGDNGDAFPFDADNDIDGDGVSGHIDNCPLDANSDQTDSDGNGIGDACDVMLPVDSDSDGVPDSEDAFPNDPTETQDSDGDGIGDNGDAFPLDADNDIDGDGVSGHIDNCPADSNPDQSDSDGDGLGDVCDAIDNNGGVLFSGQLQNLRTDLCIQVENSSTNPGANVEPGNCVEQLPQQLLNFKPIAGEADKFTLEFSHSGLCMDVANGSAADAATLVQQTCDNSASQQFRVIDEGSQWVIYTGTGSGNKVVDSHSRRSDIIQYRDYGNNNQRWRFFTRTEVQDSDGDGVPDSQDLFPNDSTETVDSDGDGIGDNSDSFPQDPNNDSDGDGISGHIDNCPFDTNPDQTDIDNDGIGDACDEAQPIDSDDDGVPDSEDVFPNDPTETLDSDQDGIGDNSDAFPLDANNDSDGDGISGHIDNCPEDSNPDQADIDNDGIGDVCDPTDNNQESGFTGQLQNLRTNRCIQVASSSQSAGANVNSGSCQTGAQQQSMHFSPIEGENDTFNLVFEHSQQCLTVANSSTKNLASLIQRPCENSSGQRFRLIDEGNQWVLYTGTGDGRKVVDSHARKNDIIQYKDYGNDNQRWRFFSRTD